MFINTQKWLVKTYKLISKFNWTSPFNIFNNNKFIRFISRRGRLWHSNRKYSFGDLLLKTCCVLSIAIPKKFHTILLRKNKSNTSGEKFNINGKVINSEEIVKLLGVTLDYNLDFDPHISNICKKGATQLNILKIDETVMGNSKHVNVPDSMAYHVFLTLLDFEVPPLPPHW